jgi:hypothetical protein
MANATNASGRLEREGIIITKFAPVTRTVTNERW